MQVVLQARPRTPALGDFLRSVVGREIRARVLEVRGQTILLRSGAHTFRAFVEGQLPASGSDLFLRVARASNAAFRLTVLDAGSASLPESPLRSELPAPLARALSDLGARSEKPANAPKLTGLLAELREFLSRPESIDWIARFEGQKELQPDSFFVQSLGQPVPGSPEGELALFGRLAAPPLYFALQLRTADRGAIRALIYSPDSTFDSPSVILFAETQEIVRQIDQELGHWRAELQRLGIRPRELRVLKSGGALDGGTGFEARA